MQLGNLVFQNLLRPFVEFSSLTGEHLAIDNRAFHTRRAVERSIFYVARFFAEDGAQKFFFRRQLRFTFRRYFANQNVARLHRCADADDAAFVQIPKEAFRDIRNISCDFLRSQLGIAGFHFQLFNMYRSVVVFLNQLLGNNDCVFEVIAAPWHEGHQHVAAKRQFAQLRARTVGQHIALFHSLTQRHNRLLGNTSVLVRALELDQRINVRSDFTRHLSFMGGGAVHTDNDAFAIDRIHNTGALADNHRPGIASRDALHAGTHKRRFGAQQRYSLALHVRSHQCAVSVIVFKERNQAGGNRNKLFRADVHVLYFFTMNQNEVTLLPGVH